MKIKNTEIRVISLILRCGTIKELKVTIMKSWLKSDSLANAEQWLSPRWKIDRQIAEISIILEFYVTL